MSPIFAYVSRRRACAVGGAPAERDLGSLQAFRRSAPVAPREDDRLVAAQAFARYFDSGEYSRSD